jgi:hypothetical protein
MIVADNGSNWYLSGAPNPSWNDADINLLKGIHGSDFQVVDLTPQVQSLSATSGSTAGGTQVTINGLNYSGGAGLTKVYFGSTQAASIQILSDTQILVTAPAHAAGTVDVTVQSGYGTSALVAGDKFTYSGSVSSASSFVVSGFPASITAGTAANFTVTAKDSSGNTVTGYTGTVHFTSSDVQAGLPADYTFVSSDNGTHTFSATLKTAGTQSLTATDKSNSNITGSESGIVVNPAAASTLTVASFPTPTTAGSSGNVTVTAKDAYGNTVTGYVGTVHFTSSDAQAALPADYTFALADNGTHTFSATLKTAGTQSLTATDKATSSITGTQSGIVVNAAAVDHLQVTAPSSAAVGSAFNVTVTAQDVYNNTATSYAGIVHFTSTDAQALLPANYTFVSSDNGQHTFASGVTFKTSGSQTLTAADTVTATVKGSASVQVTVAAAASSFTVTGFPSSIQAGKSGTFTVTAKDASGNTVAGYLGTVHFTSTDGQAVLPSDYTFVASDNGAHTFSATLKTAGTQSLTATDKASASVTGSQTGITVTPGDPKTFTVALPSSVTAGTAFNVTVTALDLYGNVSTQYHLTIHFTSTDPLAVLPANYTFVASTDKGVHTFSVTLNTVGNQTITVNDTVVTTRTGSGTTSVAAGASPGVVLAGGGGRTASPIVTPPRTLDGSGTTSQQAAHERFFASLKKNQASGSVWSFSLEQSLRQAKEGTDPWQLML